LIGGYPIFSPKLIWDDHDHGAKPRRDDWGGEIAHAKGGINRQNKSQWIGLREKLQESPIFNGKIYGFL
jgi:hypothetical protein